jgi:hypothetical protein
MSDASVPRLTLELELFADYFQFTLEDERQAERVSRQWIGNVIGQ